MNLRHPGSYLEACVCVCRCWVSGGRLTGPPVIMLPSSRLMRWEAAFVSLFALVNERKEGEPIQYTQSVNRGTLSGVCVCVSEVTASCLTSEAN